MVAEKRKKRVTVRGVLNGRFFESEWFRRNRILLVMIFFFVIHQYNSKIQIREGDP